MNNMNNYTKTLLSLAFFIFSTNTIFAQTQEIKVYDSCFEPLIKGCIFVSLASIVVIVIVILIVLKMELKNTKISLII